MAGILSKTNLFCPSHHRFSISVSPKSSSFFKLQPLKSSSNSEFHGFKLVYQQTERKPRTGNLQALPIQMSLCVGKAQRWWQKGIQPNMKEVTSAQDLYDSLFKAGDKLVIVDFFSPGCGGCKALHPKICQFAEMNPDALFLQVNYEEHKSMCYSLNVHVLPFFRFYRGAHGRLCSFSCTNATIKKFKDALAKHTTERCSLGPAKGLEEAELIALAANKDLSFNYTPKPATPSVAEPIPAKTNVPLPSTPSIALKESEDKTLVATPGR